MPPPDILVRVTLPQVWISLSLRTFVDHPTQGRVFPAETHHILNKWCHVCPGKMHITHVDNHGYPTDGEPSGEAGLAMLKLAIQASQFPDVAIKHIYAIVEFGESFPDGKRVMLSTQAVDFRPRKLDFLRGVTGLEKGKRVISYQSIAFPTAMEAINHAMVLSGYDLEWIPGRIRRPLTGNPRMIAPRGSPASTVTPLPRYPTPGPSPPTYDPFVSQPCRTTPPIACPQPRRGADQINARQLARASWSEWNGEFLNLPQPLADKPWEGDRDSEFAYEEVDEEPKWELEAAPENKQPPQHRLPALRDSIFLPFVPGEWEGPSSR